MVISHSIPINELRATLSSYFHDERMAVQVSDRSGNSTIRIELSSGLIDITEISRRVN